MPRGPPRATARRCRRPRAAPASAARRRAARTRRPGYPAGGCPRAPPRRAASPAERRPEGLLDPHQSSREPDARLVELGQRAGRSSRIDGQVRVSPSTATSCRPIDRSASAARYHAPAWPPRTATIAPSARGGAPRGPRWPPCRPRRRTDDRPMDRPGDETVDRHRLSTAALRATPTTRRIGDRPARPSRAVLPRARPPPRPVSAGRPSRPAPGSTGSRTRRRARPRPRPTGRRARRPGTRHRTSRRPRSRRRRRPASPAITIGAVPADASAPSAPHFTATMGAAAAPRSTRAAAATSSTPVIARASAALGSRTSARQRRGKPPSHAPAGPSWGRGWSSRRPRGPPGTARGARPRAPAGGRGSRRGRGGPARAAGRDVGGAGVRDRPQRRQDRPVRPRAEDHRRPGRAGRRPPGRPTRRRRAAPARRA